MTAQPQYFAIVYATNGEVFTKEGTIAEITTWLNGFVTVDIQSVDIGKIITTAVNRDNK